MQNKKVTFIALAAVLLTVGALWFTNRAVTPKEATWDDVLAEAKAGSYQIITAEELASAIKTMPKAFFWWITARNGNTAPVTSWGQ